MMSMTDDSLNYRKQLAQDLRDKRDDVEIDYLAVDYVVLFENRIPTLKEIDLLLKAEGTDDVISALYVMDCILTDHPAYTVILRLYHGQSDVPDDKTIQRALDEECAHLRSHLNKHVELTMDGQKTLPDFADNATHEIENANIMWRNRRLVQTNALLPARVREIWMLCMTLEIAPFNTSETSHQPS